MKRVLKLFIKTIAIIFTICFSLGFIVGAIEKIIGKYKAGILQNNKINTHIYYGPYEQYFKRPLDFSLSLLAIIFLWPILIIIGLLVKKKLGSPILFKQERPGLNEKLFILHKYRTMSDERDTNGNLKTDSERMTSFGKKLRRSSLDELPELFDILLGNLSIVGPRPQLIQDMVFMSDEHRKRHEVMPGLTGLAQVNGRNGISWEEKLNIDLEYSQKITFWGDMKIILQTIMKVLTQEGINEAGQVTALDYGDYLLRSGTISHIEYEKLQEKAKNKIIV